MLDDAADSAQTRAVCLTDCMDMRLNAVVPAEVAVLGTVIARVRIKLGNGSAGDLGQMQQMPKEARVVDVGGRGDGAERQAVGATTTWYLVSGLPRSAGLGPESTASQTACGGTSAPVRRRLIGKLRPAIVSDQP